MTIPKMPIAATAEKINERNRNKNTSSNYEITPLMTAAREETLVLEA